MRQLYQNTLTIQFLVLELQSLLTHLNQGLTNPWVTQLGYALILTHVTAEFQHWRQQILSAGAS
jgi:hypothetical protein